jgi:coiled-coil and C2 domain-containing protein 2A
MLEKDRQGVPFSEIEHMEKLKQITAGYDVQGFPIHVPWTDEEAVIDAVFNTDIHTNAEPVVEFALGVYVHPFPNKVASVWLYLAAMVNNM